MRKAHSKGRKRKRKIVKMIGFGTEIVVGIPSSDLSIDKDCIEDDMEATDEVGVKLMDDLWFCMNAERRWCSPEKV